MLGFRRKNNFSFLLFNIGLVVAPRIRFLQQKQKQTKNNKPNNNESSDDESNSIKKENLSQKKIPHKNLFDFNDNNLNNDSFFTVKKNVNLKFDGESDIENVKSEDDLPQKKVKIKTKASIVKQIRKKNIKVNEKVQFDDDGNVTKKSKLLLSFYKFTLYFIPK